MEDFVAIDFETANQNSFSACSVGIAKFENGVLVDTFYSLINPEQEFDPRNIFVHGIYPEDVKNAPTYKEVYPKIKSYINNCLIVSHSSFDRNVLIKSADYYDVAYIDVDFVDTLTLSRRLVPGVKHSLEDMVNHYNIIEIHDFHNALEDAKGCGLLILSFLNEFNYPTILQLINNAGYKEFGKISSNSYTPFALTRKPAPATPLNAEDILPTEMLHTINLEDTYIIGKNIAFTGKLQSMTRSEAMSLVTNLGATFQKNVTLKPIS